MRGGKREGAGRKPDPLVGPLQRVTVWLSPEFIQWAQEEGRGSTSAGVRRLLEELDQFLGARQGVSR